MKIEQKNNYCKISYTWQERLKILFKGFTIISNDGMRHIANHLMKLCIKLQSDSNNKPIMSEDEQDIK